MDEEEGGNRVGGGYVKLGKDIAGSSPTNQYIQHGAPVMI